MDWKSDFYLKFCLGNDMKKVESFIENLLEQERKKLEEYARKMRKDVEDGTYCRNQDGEWKNGYDCAMYDILSIINK